jgi:hypothetical protein
LWPQCPTKEIDFRHCPNLAHEQAEIQANIIGSNAMTHYQITCRPLKVLVFAGSESKIELPINKVEKGWGDYVDICHATTHGVVRA